MKTVTTKEALKLFEEIGHHATIMVIVKNEYFEKRKGYVLNGAIVYNPYTNKQIGMSSNKNNAKSVIKILQKTGNKFTVYSDYFNWANDDYKIED